MKRQRKTEKERGYRERKREKLDRVIQGEV